MSKKLNIIEAMKMPIGTEFEVFSTLNRKADVNMILRENENNKKYLEWVDNEPLKVFEFLMDTTFIPIQQPVSFMEVVKSKKRCMVKHEIIDNECLDIKDKQTLETFNDLDWILYSLTNNQLDIKEIILNGKWYIEESEADSND